MGYRFFICDVFTDTRFGGNQLAVLPDALGLTDRQMQQIAREFNFSESTFVFPPESGHTRRVRIFTPSAEMPFAGHPNVGTAFVLATAGELGPVDGPVAVAFEEKAGVVPIAIERRGGGIWCELSAPQDLTIGRRVALEQVAAAISLPVDAIVTDTHEPCVASVGLPFVFAELRSRAALERVRPSTPGFEAIRAEGIVPDIHLYVRSGGEVDIRARMFAPFDGVPEDPATGSANCALVALLTHYHPAADGTFTWRIVQGVEMGRPSLLEARTEKKGGRVVSTRIGGSCVLVGEGVLYVEP